MVKALFLDLDETLCDTTGANMKALQVMAGTFSLLFEGEGAGNGEVQSEVFVERYLNGIYRNLDERYASLLLPVTDEGDFRLALIELILKDMGLTDIPEDAAQTLQDSFDDARKECLDFFPGIEQMLSDFRQQLALVVITNGPEFSQVAKVEAVSLQEHVDHIIIGGQEPEEKPAASIFHKALQLAGCEAHEAIHIGDSLKADIAGANKVLIPSVWVSHGQVFDTEIGATPTYQVDSPTELPELLTEIVQAANA